MAQLAIKDHPTRCKDAIEILEMLSGINAHNLYGDKNYAYYTIDSDKEIKGGIYIFGNEDLLSFTIEEFEEKFPYKVGDKVKNARINDFIGRITNVRWDCNENQIIYVVEWNDATKSTLPYFARDLQPYKEEIMEGKNNNNWAKWDLLDGYEFQDEEGNVIKTGVIKLVKKQPQYPKTYEECCKIMGAKSDRHYCYTKKDKYEDYPHEVKLLDSLDYLRQLLICRDAYWKIAGERMGLSEPWVLPFNENQDSKPMYFIVNKLGKIYKDNANIIINNRILAFPTKEMRDVFYENFKELIEHCKELL